MRRTDTWTPPLTRRRHSQRTVVRCLSLRGRRAVLSRFARPRPARPAVAATRLRAVPPRSRPACSPPSRGARVRADGSFAWGVRPPRLLVVRGCRDRGCGCVGGYATLWVSRPGPAALRSEEGPASLAETVPRSGILPKKARLREVRNKRVMMHRNRVGRASWLCIITLVFRPSGGPVWCFAPCLPGIHAGDLRPSAGLGPSAVVAVAHPPP